MNRKIGDLISRFVDFVFDNPFAAIPVAQMPLESDDQVACLHPVEFSETHDKNILLKNSRTVAIRLTSSDYDPKGIIHVDQPLQPNSIFVVQILGKDNCYVGSLDVGIMVDPSDEEYTPRKARDVARGLEEGDTLTIVALERNEYVRKQRSSRTSLELRMKDKLLCSIEYDPGRNYHLFFDICCSTTKIKAFSAVVPLFEGDTFSIPNCTSDPESNTLIAHFKIQTSNLDYYSDYSQKAKKVASKPTETSKSHISAVGEASQSKTTANDSLPLKEAASKPAEIPKPPISTTKEESQCNTTTNDDQRKFEKVGELPTCNVCFDDIVNAVLIPCAHMCLCEKCAIEIMSSVENGAKTPCPICRCLIQKVMKVYL